MMAAAYPGRPIRLTKYEWTLGEKIGNGGSGSEVYAARSAAHSRAAAKLIPKAPGVPREMAFERLPDGVRNVIPILDSGETPTSWAIVMPRAETSLERYLLEHPVPPLAEAVKILTDVATALSDLHDHVVHRDIKPANILTCDGTWQVSDFGIARAASAATATYTKKEALSAAYAAPEQWDQRRATPATDVYAWGVLAFEVLTGRLPFVGPCREDFAHQHRYETAPPLDDAPDDLAVLVEECLYKGPQARPSAKAILDRLARLNVPRTAGLAELADANRYAHDERRKWDRLLSVQASADKDREMYYSSALQAFRRLSDRLWFAMRETATAAQEDGSFAPGWCLRLRDAALRLGVPQRTKPTPWPAGDGPDLTVVAHTRIDVEVRNAGDGYTGRNHSLWFFCDAADGGRFRWHETGFRYRGFPHVRSSQIPFALDPDADAGAALLGTSRRYEVQVPLTCLDYDGLQDFIDRWAAWFARAARGELRFDPGSSVQTSRHFHVHSTHDRDVLHRGPQPPLGTPR